MIIKILAYKWGKLYNRLKRYNHINLRGDVNNENYKLKKGKKNLNIVNGLENLNLSVFMADEELERHSWWNRHLKILLSGQ